MLIDDDELIIDISSYSVNVDEGGTATVDVRLLQQPNTTANTTVNFVASNDKISAYRQARRQRKRGGSGVHEDNWQTNRQLIIVGEQDADDIDDRATINILVISRLTQILSPRTRRT